MKIKNLLQILLMGFLTSLIFSSCMKKDEIATDPVISDNMKDLQVGSSFDWSTTTMHSIKFKAYAQSLVKISTPEGKMLKVGMLSNEKTVELSFNTPSYLKKVNISFLGNDYELELNDSNQMFNFE
jgi:hypothetical protein